ncbi:aminoglycoside phosphotransferase family protein [Streptomyces sp. NPDC052644]
MTFDPAALYEEARTQEGAAQSGHYNRNVRVESEGGPVVIRMRTSGATAEPMDLTLWPEAEVLAAVNPYVPSAPRLLHASAAPEFQIHAYIEGRRLDDVSPDGKPLPEYLPEALGAFFGQLLRVPARALPPVPADWPRDGDTRGFAERLLALVGTIRHRGDAAVMGLYEALGVPGDPCGLLRRRAADLARRPFRLLHADVHRKNLILTEGDRDRVAFLDWELALWGDPVYDLADHLHKMACTPGDRAAVTAAWLRAAPPECVEGWREDLDYYLSYEAVKSAIVDTVRWGRRIVTAPTAAARVALTRELAAKLEGAHSHWAPSRPAPPTPGDVDAAVRRCLERPCR